MRLLIIFAAVSWLAIFAWRGSETIAAMAPTFDEATYLHSGFSAWSTGQQLFSPEHPPLLRLLLALPPFLIEGLPYQPPPDVQALRSQFAYGAWFLSALPEEQRTRVLAEARFTNLAIGLLLVALVGWWASRLWGAAGGLLAMGFAALDPNLLAHSCVVTLDAGIALFGLLVFYALWEHLRNPRPGWFLLIGLGLGLALATKFTAVFFIVAGVLVLAGHFLAGGRFAISSARSAEPLKGLLEAILALLLIAAAVVVPCYFVVHSWLWLAGFKGQLFRTETVQQWYLLGEIHREKRWFYYPIVLLVKVPLGTLAATALSLATCRMHPRLGRTEALTLLLPAGLYLGLLIFTGVNLGLRLALPVLPFLWVLLGRLAVLPRLRWLGWLLLAGVAISTHLQHPHALAYFNEIVGRPEEGYRWAADSNLDWGQDLLALRDQLAGEKADEVFLCYYGTAEPEAYGMQTVWLPAFMRARPPVVAPAPTGRGKVVLAISINCLLGLVQEPADRWRFLEGRPFRLVGRTIHLYDISQEPQIQEQLRALHLEGLQSWQSPATKKR